MRSAHRRLALALAALLWATGAIAAERPNVVLIFVDDLGYGDVAPYDPSIDYTPHIERLANEGVRFTDFYATALCSASRAQLLTGALAPRVSMPGALRASSWWGLHPDEQTIAEYLADAGYATALIGKWHVGDQAETLPTKQGFATYFGVPYSNDSDRPEKPGGPRYLPLMRGERVVERLTRDDQRQLTSRYTEESEAWLAARAKAKQPFFLMLSHTAVHLPLAPHPRFRGKSGAGDYADWVAEVDWSTGRIVATLEEHDLTANTLVLFVSDNGPEAKRGIRLGNAGPLRGAKGSTDEGGVRVPSIARWPGRIAAGRVATGIAATTDLLPTLTALAGIPADRLAPHDGVDLGAYLLGRSETSPREHWPYFKQYSLRAYREGRWKLVRASPSGRGQPRPLPTRLFDLAGDPGETTDRAADHPEIVERLEARAKALQAEIGDKPRQPGPGRRPAHYTKHPVKRWLEGPPRAARVTTPAAE